MRELVKSSTERKKSQYDTGIKETENRKYKLRIMEDRSLDKHLKRM